MILPKYFLPVHNLRSFTFVLFCLDLLFFAPYLAIAADLSIPKMIGGGNIHPGGDAVKFNALKTLGAGMCRIPISPGDYWNGSRATPERTDNGILMAHENGITPMILFEYYTRWNGDLGSSEKWEGIGRAFAERFRPNSQWLTSRGIEDWGVTFYSAVNEPMWRDNNPTPIPVDRYVGAMEGLADGVHSVDASLRVCPGGFQEIPLISGNNYGPAIAHLYNNGKLYAIDIHRYYDVQWQPMAETFQNSLQNQFDEVKEAWGITADIKFYTTEFNFKKRLVSEDEAAVGFLTAIWDALGVVGNNGQSVTQFTLPWNIFNTTGSDAHYGLCTQSNPWTPIARGRVLQMVCQLASGMRFVSLDPKTRGEYILNGNDKKMWVWQNRTAWTNHLGSSYTVADVPPGATRLEVYGWDGLRRTLQVSGQTSLEVADLNREETYMFLADAEDEAVSLAPVFITTGNSNGNPYQVFPGPIPKIYLSGSVFDLLGRREQSRKMESQHSVPEGTF
jgi:hypothetical protein